GNAYSDEILHRARLSPVKLSRQLTDDEVARLLEACRATLALWVERLRTDAAGEFPEGVTAFRPDMAVHGRHRPPRPRRGTAGPPHRPRRHRDQLLPALPARRPAPRRPRAVAPAPPGLAANDRRARGAPPRAPRPAARARGPPPPPRSTRGVILPRGGGMWDN